MKKATILGLLIMFVISCSEDTSSNGNVTLKASAVTASKPSTTGRLATTSTPVVVLTDFQVNLGGIKFETDALDVRHEADPSHEDFKLNGPFLLDLMNPDAALTQIITSVSIPNAKYEEIKFMFVQSTVAGDMQGKTFLLKGTIDGKPFVVWSSEEVHLEMDFADPSKDFTVNNADLTLNIKMQLDAVIARISALANQGLLLDTDGDGVIEITTELGDGHHVFGHEIQDLLENETHLDDKD
jgi:hypothetical protein